MIAPAKLLLCCLCNEPPEIPIATAAAMMECEGGRCARFNGDQVMLKFCSGLILAALLTVQPLLAEAITPEDSLVLDRWEVELGGFATGLNTRIRFDEVVGNQGTTIDLEEDLGYDNNEAVFSITAARMIGRRHHLSLTYLDVSREGFVEADSEIEWGDEIFPVGASLASSYDAEFLGLNYTYWVRSQEKSAWGPTVSLIVFSTGSALFLQGEGSGPGFSRDDDFSVDVPLIQVGFKFRQAMSQKWVFAAEAAFVAFDDIDDFSGDVISGGVTFEHRTWKNFGFGGGYRLRDFDIDSGEKRTLGQYVFEMRGLVFFGRLAF